MKRQILMLVSCCLGVLFLSGTLSLGQSPPPPDSANPGCLESTCRNVPVREKLTAIKLTKHMRGIFGGFEQGAGIAGGLQLTSADIIPAVEFRATVLASTRFYRRIDAEAYVPHILGSRNHGDLWFSYARRENNFFGIGPQTTRDLKTHFATEQRSYQGSLSRDIANHLQAGLYAELTNSLSSPGSSNSDTPIGETYSSTPNPDASRWLPGFLSNTKILTYGGFFEYDTRDKTMGLTRGINAYGRAASNTGLRNKGTFSDYGWIEGELDLRGYVPLGSPRTSLALRSMGQIKKPTSGSQIPFYDLSWLGGREYVRGYETYRFRANNVLIASAELRRTVYSKSDIRGVDVFGFTDSGQVWGDARSLTDFSSRKWHSGAGGGVQYRHSNSFAARLEVGRSHEGTLLYISMSRGF